MKPLHEIINIIKEVTGVDIIKNTSRKREVTDARKIYFHLAKQLNIYSLEEIGEPLGYNHASVLYNCKECENLIQTDPSFYKTSERIKTECIRILSKLNRIEFLRKKYLHHKVKADAYSKRIQKLKHNPELFDS